MSKRTTFEEILNEEIRWPKQGDVPFVRADDPYENANIAEDGFSRLVLMMGGYKLAADTMVERASAESVDRDLLVFPIIFNYRQFLELSLKYLLAMYGPTVGVEANWSTHDLAALWSEFRVVLENYGTVDPDKTDPIVGSIVLEFAKIDPGSYSYRYPVDRQGNPVPLMYNELHLETLADVMEAVDAYFTGCDGYLSHLQGAGP